MRVALLVAAAFITGSLGVASAVEYGGEQFEAPLDDYELGNACRMFEDEWDGRDELSALLLGMEVSASFIAMAYSPTENQLTGKGSMRAGSYVGEYFVFIDVSNASLPDSMRKDDKLRVIGTMGTNEFISNGVDGCYVNILATAVVPDGF